MQVIQLIALISFVWACQPQRKAQKTDAEPEPAPAPAVSADQEPRLQTCLMTSPVARLLSQTGCVEPQDPTRPASSLVAYDIVAPLWSDGSDKQRYMALPVGLKARFDAQGHLELPVGSVTIKHFALQGRPVETRLYKRESLTTWKGYSYEWRDDGRDAVLLETGKEKDIGGQTWVYPAPRQCESCHSQAASITLGLTYVQLAKSDQIRTLEKAGVVEADATVREARLVDSTDAREPIDARARSYLHGNCAYCHQPQGNGLGGFDLRITNDFAGLGVCNTKPLFEVFPVQDARLYKPGVPSESILLLRMKDGGTFHMPPQVARKVDPAGVDLIEKWVLLRSNCDL